MRAAIYARKSTTQDTDKAELSTERQIRDAQAFAASRGWTVDAAHVYVDESVSGSEWKGRHEFKRLLDAVATRPPFQHLIVMEQSRIGRDSINTPVVIQQIEEAGVSIWAYQTKEQITVSTEQGEILTLVHGIAGVSKRREASRSVRRSHIDKVSRGFFTGKAPFGYCNIPAPEYVGDPRKAPRRRVIDPVQASAVVRCFELVAEGYGYLRLAKKLNEEGVPAPRAQWEPNGCKAVLRNELYRGVFAFAKTQWEYRGIGQARTKYKITSPDAPVTVDHPELQIVSTELWNAAHARLSASRAAYLKAAEERKPVDTTRVSVHLLSGLLYCDVCKGRLIAVEGGKGYACQRAYKQGRKGCTASRRHSMAALDAEIRKVLDRSLAPDNAALIVERWIEKNAAAPDAGVEEQAAVKAEIARLEVAKRRLLDALEAGADVKDIRGRLDERNRELATAQARAEHLQGLALSSSKWQDESWLRKLQVAIEERRVGLRGDLLPVEIQRQLLRRLVERVTVIPAADGTFTLDIVLAVGGFAGVEIGTTTASSGERVG